MAVNQSNKIIFKQKTFFLKFETNFLKNMFILNFFNANAVQGVKVKFFNHN